MTKKAIIYTTPTCPFCKKTKDWFKEHDVDFTEYNVAEDEDKAKEMIQESGQTGVPVWKVIEKGETKRIVVGYDVDALEEEFS